MSISLRGDTTSKVEMPAAALSAPASAYAETVKSAGGVVLDLFGEIGPDKPLSLDGIKTQLFRAAGGCGVGRIHLIIDSTGGSVVETKRIYSFLRNQPGHVSAEVGRYCQSAAVTLLLAAAYRVAKIESQILIHGTRISTSSIKSQELTARDLRERAEMLERDDNEAIDTMAERTGYRRSWFEQQFQNEDSLDLCEAMESGLVHEIAGLSLRCDPRWIERVRATPRNVFWPRRCLTPNFFAACRAALPRKDFQI
jgi:ATP-dependent protease ClpP protease subunit